MIADSSKRKPVVVRTNAQSRELSGRGAFSPAQRMPLEVDRSASPHHWALCFSVKVSRESAQVTVPHQEAPSPQAKEDGPGFALLSVGGCA